MRAAWSDHRRFSTWRRVWLALARAQHELGLGPTAEQVAAIGAEKLATDIVLLDMREAVGYTDWFVVMCGRNTRQVQAIAEEVALRM